MASLARCPKHHEWKALTRRLLSCFRRALPRAAACTVSTSLGCCACGSLPRTMLQTMDVAASRRRDRPDVTDVKFVIRKDDRKMQRVRYLLDMQAHIQTATKDGKNLTAAYAEEAAAAALNTSGAPGGPAAAGSRGTHSGSAGALGVAGSGSAGKGAAHPPASSGAPGGVKPVGAKTSGGGGAGGGPGKASAFKPPPAPR